MDATVSVSKGCFVFNSSPRKKSKVNHKKIEENFETELWFKAYKMLQHTSDSTLQIAYDEIYSTVLKDLVTYVNNSHDVESINEVVPAATLLTGINMPDHAILFERLSTLLHNSVTPHVATLQARDCTTIRACVEQIVGQLINQASKDTFEEDNPDEETSAGTIKKQQCTFFALECWYKQIVSNTDTCSKFTTGSTGSSKPRKSQGPSSPLKSNKDLESTVKKSMRSPLKRTAPVMNEDASPTKCTKKTGRGPIIVIVIPEFEVFNMKVLQSLISLVSFQGSVLPITFVFGVATSVQALQQGLTFRVSSRLDIKVFHSQKSITFLDHVLEEVLLNENASFLLGEKTFKLFCEVFLFYDFSVKGFTQLLKFCMMEHLFGRDINSLCCPLPQVTKVVAKLTQSNLKEVRDLPSFQKHLQTCLPKKRESLLHDDNLLKKEVEKLIFQLHYFMHDFYLTLRVVHILCSTLPNAPLGLQVRKVYEIAISGKLFDSREYKECMKLLGFLSRDELLLKLKQVIDIFSQSTNTLAQEKMSGIIAGLREHYEHLQKAGLEPFATISNAPRSPKKKPNLAVNPEGKKVSRTQFLLNMKESCSQEKPMTEFEQARKTLLEYISTCLSTLLPPITSLPLHEVILFDDVNTVRHRLVGAPRAAVHMALNNPCYYLKCECCSLPSSSAILSSLPDVCIAYKLHLECGKLINLYDWLQSFSAIIQSKQTSVDGQEEREVNPEIQARFARSVAELQFLGFIKASKKKTDHVTRLTSNPSGV